MPAVEEAAQNAALHSSLWARTAREQFDAPPLTRNHAVDLLVIGGGFTGTAAALEAARRGASVCLLEAETVGHGGSGRNVGLVNAGLWLPPDAVLKALGDKEGGQLVSVLGQGPQKVFSLIEREAIDCEPVRRGTLHLAHAAKGLADLRKRLRQGNRHGAPLSILDPAETARRTGSGAFLGALFDPRAGTIQPLAYCRGLARAATAHGAQVHEQSPVTALTRSNDTWCVVANGCTVRAGHVLIATNAYHFGFEEPCKPAYVAFNYCQFATVPIPPDMRRTILPGGEGCWDTAMVMSSIRIDGAGRLIVGGVGSLEVRGASVHHAWARRKLRALYPALADIAFEQAWSGRIAMTSDHIPKIVACGHNALACFGYSGRGIAPGTLFGTQAATALLDGDPGCLPLRPVDSHVERFAGARAGYYEFGAKLIHGLSARRRPV
ncbi:NAD(P)/FAD-dependent oxidoreductase [Pseudohoeflea coraliihabitans]|uniref:FAD-binding oxidoreductase n=1 Tax=Pseudohoeflea coraliihabitans TaxID=2860393 RepID=A0ABS6WT85_9HYPH|nr:FAD-dependent oxidoreductase [Pseudohoeflea sp. DP4N28-3]MBW3098264.1 FAD-binding oxidoreductase [Pseudohoeflea sp. DP4N28-3]